MNLHLPRISREETNRRLRKSLKSLDEFMRTEPTKWERFKCSIGLHHYYRYYIQDRETHCRWCLKIKTRTKEARQKELDMVKMRDERKRRKAALKKVSEDWYAKVRSLPCRVRMLGYGYECFGQIVHHHKTGAGGALKSEYWKTMPLCIGHHTSNNFGKAVHNGTKTFETNYESQDGMILNTFELLGEDYADYENK